MGFDQKGDIVFEVSPGEGGIWNVNEKGFDKPLASFDCERDAVNYATDIAKSKPGSRVIVERQQPVSRP